VIVTPGSRRPNDSERSDQTIGVDREAETSCLEAERVVELERAVVAAVDVDNDPSRADLTEHGRGRAQEVTADPSPARIRLHVESEHVPEVAARAGRERAAEKSPRPLSDDHHVVVE